MAKHIADLFGIVGSIFLSYGCWLAYPPAGYIMFGVLLLAGGYLIASAG